ncbi:JAB domain-containing protein [Aureispira sp. CCB-QB1]|uniref:JAB domain-containing protein n=1 Tax=Aureispira sp. CCB-QB1 TaxID=1313421 RepID=UPI000696BFE0|nr:JAB domain-containing protein [Aureispira sp. CCB-QB1]
MSKIFHQYKLTCSLQDIYEFNIKIMFFFQKNAKKQIGKIPQLFNSKSDVLLNQPDLEKTHIIDSSKLAWQFFHQYWNHSMINLREDYMVLFLTKDLCALGYSIEDEGDHCSCTVNLKRVICRAKAIGSSAIITAHNHPKSLGLPSIADIKAERALKKFASLRGIRHLEHIILSKSKWHYSFASMFIL